VDNYCAYIKTAINANFLTSEVHVPESEKRMLYTVSKALFVTPHDFDY